MTDEELLECFDGRVWAREFCKIAVDKGFDPTNEEDIDWLSGWFANAIMSGYDRNTKEQHAT